MENVTIFGLRLPDGGWAGNSLGPLEFVDKKDAAIAAILLEERLHRCIQVLPLPLDIAVQNGSYIGTLTENGVRRAVKRIQQAVARMQKTTNPTKPTIG